MYKKRIFILTVLFVLVYTNNNAQEFTCESGGQIVNLTESCSQIPGIYEGRDRVSLKYGYKFNISEGTMRARLNETMIIDHEYTSAQNVPDILEHEINTNLEVGAIRGIANVTETGAGSYNIPLNIPPGVAGLEPSITINYNSQSSHGILGYKWHLSGISTINRVPQSQYYDGDISKIQWNNNDRFVLDGTRLLPKNGSYDNYGENNFKYEKEITDFSTITSHVNNPETGPEYFTLKTKDGYILEYGKTSDARSVSSESPVIATWFINKISDRNGNYMTFTYDNSNNQTVISEIKYTGNANAYREPTNKITFVYENKSVDRNRLFISNGRYMNSDIILKKIIIRTNDVIHRKYEFNYFTDNLYTKLFEIKKFGINNEEVNATVMNYGNNGYLEMAHTSSNIHPEINQHHYFGDFSGNGKTDIIVMEDLYDTIIEYGPGNQITISLNSAGHKLDFFHNMSHSTAINFTKIDLYETTDTYIVQPVSNIADKNTYFVSDFTGNFRDDLLMIGIEHKAEHISFEIPGFEEPDPQIANNFINPGFPLSLPISSVNFTTLRTNKIKQIRILSIIDTLFNANFRTYTFPHDADYRFIHNRIENNFLIGDYSGNGAIELITILINWDEEQELQSLEDLNYEAFLFIPSIDSLHTSIKFASDEITKEIIYSIKNRDNNVYTINFDGSGKQNIMLLHDIGCTIYELDIGEEFVSFIEIYSGNFPDNNVSIEAFGDFNGDGKTDFVFAVEQIYCGYHESYYAATIKVCFSTGNDFLIIDTAYNIGSGDRVYHEVIAGDLKADGTTDLLIMIYHGQNTYERRLKYEILYSKGFPDNLEDDIFLRSEMFEIMDILHSYHTNNFLKTITNSFFYTDLIGDGKTDIFYLDRIPLLYEVNQLPQQPPSNRTKGIYLNYNDNSQFVTGIRDGLGHKIFFRYMPLTNTTNYKPNYQIVMAKTNLFEEFPTAKLTAKYFREFFSPIPVVTQLKINNAYDESDAKGACKVTTYTYQGSIIDLQKRQWLGFCKILQETNYLMDIESAVSSSGTSFLRQRIRTINRPVYFGVKLKTYENMGIVNNTNLSNNFWEYSVIQPNPLNPQVRFIYPKTQRKKDKYMNVVKTKNDIDDWGNIVNSITNMNSNNIITETFNTFTNAGLDIPHKISESHSITTYTGQQPYERIISYEYDINGSLIKQTDNTSNIQLLYENRNAFGLPCKIRTVFPDKPEKYNIYNYSNCGRFLTQESNNMGLTTKYKFDPAVNNLTEIKNSFGNETKFAYDNLNRLIERTSPEGIIVTTNYDWETDHENENIVYSVKINSQNSPYVKNYYDKLHRVVKTETVGYNNQKVLTENKYNRLGKIAKTSEPFFENESPLFNVFEYHYSNEHAHKLEKETSARGLVTNYAYGNRMKTVTLPSNQSYTKHYNIGGDVIQSNFPMNNQVKFTYGSHGDPVQIIANSVATTMDYNELFFQTGLNDASAGTTNYEYFNDGQLKKQTDARGMTSALVYDEYDRIQNIQMPDDLVNYEYYTDGHANTLLKAITSQHSELSYNYDEFQRIIKASEEIDNQTYSFSYEYNQYARLSRETYPNGFKIEYIYDNNGFLTGIKDATTNSIIWQSSDYNVLGQINSINLKNNLNVSYIYDNNYLFLKEIFYKKGQQTIFEMEYDFDPGTGNMLSRTDKKYDITEHFSYDALNRLTEYTLQSYSNNDQYNITYDVSGNILTKSDVGTYSYDQTKRHAVTKITPFEESLTPGFSIDNQQIEYNSFNKATRISEGDYELFIYYGYDRERRKTELFHDGQKVYTRYFLGKYEIEIREGITREFCYIPGPSGIIAVYITENGEGNLYYLVNDHQNSVLAIMDIEGEILEEQRFDPWGQYRNLYTGNLEKEPQLSMLFRGYTAHEMLPEFGLINMNGRLYDPVIARVLSPDNFVQNPYNPQNYNRYSYCYNNPLVYVDPDGNFIQYVFYAMGMFTNIIGNLIVGADDPIGTAHRDVTYALNIPNDMLQFNVFQNDNIKVTAGIDFYAIGLSANIYNKQGDFTKHLGFGVGLMSGPYVSTGMTYSDDRWLFGLGVGAGKNYTAWGANASYKGYGAGYYRTSFGEAKGPDGVPNPQTVGGLAIYYPNGLIRLENDLFGDTGDRWRTSAVEIAYKDFVIGKSVYTNEPKDNLKRDEEYKSRVWNHLGRGKPTGDHYTYSDSEVFSSPFYIGTRHGNLVSRLGINHPVVQDITQNGVHIYIKKSPLFKTPYQTYSGFWGYSGYYNPYSLY